MWLYPYPVTCTQHRHRVDSLTQNIDKRPTHTKSKACPATQVQRTKTTRTESAYGIHKGQLALVSACKYTHTQFKHTMHVLVQGTQDAARTTEDTHNTHGMCAHSDPWLCPQASK